MYYRLKNISCSVIILLVTFGYTFGQELFDASSVHEIWIETYEEDYWTQLEDNYSDYLTSSAKNYIPVKVNIDGESIDSVGLRFKGQYSNTGFEGVKKPFKIDFNEFDKGKNFQGLKKINLQNFAADPSFLRDYISYYLLRKSGISAPKASYTKLYINEQYWGLYLVVEQIDKVFLKQHFNSSKGNLFKCINDTELSNNKAELEEEIVLKTNTTKNDWQSFFDLIAEINNPYGFNFAETFSQQFDVATYFKCLTVDVLINNWDSYHVNGRNFYLYENPSDNKFYWIPWDYNLAFWDAGMEIFPKTNTEQRNLTPLIKLIQTNQILKAEYLYVFCQYISNFDITAIVNELDTKSTLIEPFVFEDPNKFYTNSDFTTNINDEVTVKMIRSGKLKDVTLPGLTSFLKRRRNLLFSAINEYPTACDENSESKNFLSVYPNPIQSDALVKIDLKESVKELKLHVITLKGELVSETIVYNSSLPFYYSFQTVPAGNYILHVQSDDQKINLSKKISITK